MAAKRNGSSSIKNSLRLWRIAMVLARHDALFPLEKANISPSITFFCKLFARRQPHLREGQRLAQALEALGPTFIKLGQTFSTRADIVGEEIAQDLGLLRDRLPAFDSAIAIAQIEEELGKNIDDCFAHFERSAAAAASIAQVHFASLHSGEEVAVKVLRPDVEAKFAADLELFYWLADIAEKRLGEEAYRFKPRKVVDTFADTVRSELDLRFEASAAEELASNLKHDKGMVVPTIYWSYTGKNVLTMQRVGGLSVSDADALDEAGLSRRALVQVAAESLFRQVFRDGFFHADLHPGNIFVQKDGQLAVVDFGIMGRLDEDSRMFLAHILDGFLKEDYQRVAQVHVDYGYMPAHHSVEALAQACRAIGRPILGRPLEEISIAKLLQQLFEVAKRFDMTVQPHLLLLQKTMMMAEGVGRMLDPTVNMWQLAEPMISKWGHEHLGLRGKARRAAHEARYALKHLPTVLRHIKSLLERMEEKSRTQQQDNVSDAC